MYNCRAWLSALDLDRDGAADLFIVFGEDLEQIRMFAAKATLELSQKCDNLGLGKRQDPRDDFPDSIGIARGEQPGDHAAGIGRQVQRKSSDGNAHHGILIGSNQLRFRDGESVAVGFPTQ